jgi:hypothetical protein
MEYREERIKDLFRAYAQYIAECRHICMDDVYAHIVEMPTRRFWVSEIRAALVVARIGKGDKLLDMRPLKREMFFEIYRRYRAIKKEHPEWSTTTICSKVITQPAPRFYLAPGSAKIMICKAREKWRQEKLRKLQPWLRQR